MREIRGPDTLPPWNQANSAEKRRICLYSVVIYLPVAVLILAVVGMMGVYVGLYVWPMAMGGKDRPELYYWHSSTERSRARLEGFVCLGGMSLLVLLFSLSFYQVSRTSPGGVPLTPEWRDFNIAERSLSHLFQEKKQSSGTLRWCRHCCASKPDRAHHCRLCGTCVLQMDHHCPWIANCVGYFNYKYFLLMVFYALLALWLFVGTFWQTALITWRDDESGALFSFFVTVILALSFILAMALSVFIVFHMNLVLNATTTIEYCERQTKSPYSQSLYRNLQSALGKQPAFWLLPFRYRDSDEDGLSFTLPKSS